MRDELLVIGRAERINLPEFTAADIPARVDTGAKTCALWVSNINETDDKLSFSLFGPGSDYFTGEVITVNDYGQRLVSNSTGHVEERYIIKTPVIVKGRKVLATFTLADRSTQVYPVLLGRNILRGKFLVDVKLGSPLVAQEKQREMQKESTLSKQRVGKKS